MHSGGTYCFGFGGLLKYPLQAIERDVEPLDPLPSLQIFSPCWILVRSLHLRAGRTPGNGARGCWHSSDHLLSISWLSFHCCRETQYALQSPLLPSEPQPREEVYCVSKIREEVMRVRCKSWLGGSLGCGQKEEGKKFTKKEKVHQKKKLFHFFSPSLNCNRSNTQKEPSWKLAPTSAHICLTAFHSPAWQVKTSQKLLFVLTTTREKLKKNPPCRETRREALRKQVNSKPHPFLTHSSRL